MNFVNSFCIIHQESDMITIRVFNQPSAREEREYSEALLDIIQRSGAHIIFCTVVNHHWLHLPAIRFRLTASEKEMVRARIRYIGLYSSSWVVNVVLRWKIARLLPNAALFISTYEAAVRAWVHNRTSKLAA